MSRSPAFQFYPGDWLDSKVLRMSYFAQGVYIRMLCHMWRDSKDQCSMPADRRALENILGLRAGQIDKALTEIQWENDPIFLEKGGRFTSKRLQRVKRQQLAYKRAQSEAGSKGAARRWRAHKGRHGNPIDSPMADDSSSSPTPSSSPSPTDTKSGNGKEESEVDRGKALKATRSAIDLVSSEPCRHSLLEFMGYLENEQAIPARRIHDIVRKVASLRETFSMETNTPVDKLFCYSIAETMKHKAAQPSYVGKVMQNALMRYRDGALKF